MKNLDQWADDSYDRPVFSFFKIALIGTALVLLIVAIVSLATTGSLLFQGPAAKLTNHSRVEQKVYDPNNTIAQIAFFHNTCNDANAQLRIVENNQARLLADQKTTMVATDPIKQQQAITSLASDQQDVTGALNVLQSTVADYNSRSAQSTANVFKDANLPYRIVLPNPVPAGYTINCG